MISARKPIDIRGIRIGDGVPKICVPIVAYTEEEVLKAASEIIETAELLESKYPGKRLDIIEFRADYFDAVTNKVILIETLEKIRKIIGGRILLFTYRSEEEGGYLRHDRAENMIDDIYEWVIEKKGADMIDIELLQGNYYVVRTASKAHDRGIKVVMSYHNFEETPHDRDIEEYLRNMEILGADILKIAATPRTEFDVRRLMELTEYILMGKIKGYPVTHPIVSMSMGEMGKISRISGAKTGSAITFAYVGEESAPGQLTLEEMFSEM
ncbi:MAG: type I 3-dehydroquinate dehydratase [Eubacterium sp.]|nr:type I 3-dehydroquinate dehydratase [Eubacterium sp.]MCR5291793.1 type I 3-dehydroquinate dehydratase [Eubacterium sp.]